jgi:hypothetical protein
MESTELKGTGKKKLKRKYKFHKIIKRAKVR